MTSHDYLWSWWILCDYSYVIRCDHNLIRYHVVFGFEWHLATSHAWRSNPQTPWRSHRAIGWHKKKHINSCRLWSVWNVTKVRLELVLFVQVSRVFVFNHLFIGCQVKVQLFYYFSYRGWSHLHTWSYLPTSITNKMMTRSSQPPFLVSTIRRQWLSQCCINLHQYSWRSFPLTELCFGGEWGRVDDLFGGSTCVMLLDLILATLGRPWLMIRGAVCDDSLSFPRLAYFSGGADFRILN